MSILAIQFISGLLWHNFWQLPLQLCVARAGCCGHAPVRGACVVGDTKGQVDGNNRDGLSVLFVSYVKHQFCPLHS
jgi:hypothetical protein